MCCRIPDDLVGLCASGDRPTPMAVTVTLSDRQTESLVEASHPFFRSILPVVVPSFQPLGIPSPFRIPYYQTNICQRHGCQIFKNRKFINVPLFVEEYEPLKCSLDCIDNPLAVSTLLQRFMLLLKSSNILQWKIWWRKARKLYENLQISPGWKCEKN